MVIAVDGPAGAGKSTVCKLLAEKLGFAYLDTGSMYRAVAWSLIQQGISLDDPASIEERLDSLPFRFTIENGELVVYHRYKRLSEELRQPDIANWASRISRLPSVREYLTSWQRSLAHHGNVVAEGRDMTTVVFPDASIKIYLTADLPTRAKRRLVEYRSKSIEVDYSTVQQQMKERDRADQERPIAPLRPAEDAVIVDTSEMEIEQVVDRLCQIASWKMGREWPLF